MKRLLSASVFLALMHVLTLAQDIAALKAGVVRIRNTYTQAVGTGFVIKVDNERAYIITASHVVKNNEHPNVYFYANQNDPVQATLAYREDDEQKGLALLEVKAKRETLSTLMPLRLRVSLDLKGGEQVTVIGFPNGTPTWTVSTGNISSLQGRNLVFAAPIKTGNSGSPVLYNNLVVGLVTDADLSWVYAARSEGIFEYLSGLNSKLADAIKPQTPAQENVSTDKSEFCRALSRIVDSSRQGFYDISKDGYNSTILLPGLKSGRASPETQEATFYNFISDSSKARGQYYELISNSKRCLSDWKVLENDGHTRFLTVDSPMSVFLFHKDGTSVAVEHSKVTQDYMVRLSVYGANSVTGRFKIRNDTALAFAFTETEADRESVCQGLKALVDASHQGFTSVVGKPGSFSGYFEASIKVSGFPPINVRRREEAYITFNAESLSDVEALNDRLVGILTKCFPAWTVTESAPEQYDQTTRYFRLVEPNGSVFVLSYNSLLNTSAYMLYFSLYSPNAGLRFKVKQN
jgi:hypothetical protein